MLPHSHLYPFLYLSSSFPLDFPSQEPPLHQQLFPSPHTLPSSFSVPLSLSSTFFPSAFPSHPKALFFLLLSLSVFPLSSSQQSCPPSLNSSFYPLASASLLSFPQALHPLFLSFLLLLSFILKNNLGARIEPRVYRMYFYH